MPNQNTNLMISDGGGTVKKKVPATMAVGALATGAMNNVINSNSSGSSSGGGTTKAPTNPTSEGTGYSGGDYYSLLAAQLAAQKAAAQESYNRNMSRIADAYGSAAGSLRGNYDSTVDRLNAARDKSMGDVKGDAEKSLQEAYINNMLSKKNLNQRLSAMGYNGGATESTMASLSNNYGNSRTDINETLNRNIADLEQTYGDNLASALQSYNTAMANLNMQRMQLENQAEQALSNAMTGSMSGIGSLLSMDQSYLSALNNALANQGAYTYDPTAATNAFVAGQAQQAANANAGTNYAKLQAQQNLSASDTTQNAFTLYQQGKISWDDVMRMVYGG